MHQVFDEKNRSADGIRQANLTQMLLDVPLALEVLDPGLSIGLTDRRIHQVLHFARERRVSKSVALHDFLSHADAQRILQAERAIRPRQRHRQ